MMDNYSTDGAICPYCGHLARASDSDGMLFDESLCEYECGTCGEEFRVSAYNRWSWTTEKATPPAETTWHERRTMLPDGDARAVKAMGEP
jgi:DNA-directed RNA polymerase subunit RPC12/RpoP